MQQSRAREAWLSKECPAVLLAVVEKQDSESRLPTAKILSLLTCSLPAAARNASSDKLSCNDRSCPAPFRGPVTTFEGWTEMLTDRLYLLGPEDLKCNISQMTCQCRTCTAPTPHNRVSVPGHSAASKLQSQRPLWVFISKTPHARKPNTWLIICPYLAGGHAPQDKETVSVPVSAAPPYVCTWPLTSS